MHEDYKGLDPEEAALEMRADDAFDRYTWGASRKIQRWSLVALGVSLVALYGFDLPSDAQDAAGAIALGAGGGYLATLIYRWRLLAVQNYAGPTIPLDRYFFETAQRLFLPFERTLKPGSGE